jgi:ceramide glucosyltransferase
MMLQIARLLAGVTCLLAIMGVGYSLLCLWAAAAFRRTQQKPHAASAPDDFTPPVTILKPLKGTDPEIYESFRSHCRQDYPKYELIFGVSDQNDPAVASVQRLQLEFPERSIRLVVCSQELGTNVKVSNLVQMASLATHQHLVVNDSDIRVGSGYLRSLMAPLQDDRVGMVTCLYRGVPSPTLGSRLESLGISTDFAGGVLCARALEGGVRFGLGSTMAFRRRDLAAIGGFETCLDYLADDYELGARIASLGLRIQLSETVVDTFLPAYNFRDFLAHQLRWARSVRDSRRWGYIGVLFTFSLPWAMLAVVLARGASWAWILFGIALAARTAVALAIGVGILRDRNVIRLLPLLALRDLLGLAVWGTSFFGHRVAWRGELFTLKDGKLARFGAD